MKLSTRLVIIVIASILGMLVLGSYALYSLRSSMIEERKAGVRQLVHLAAKQVAYYQALEKSGKLSRDDAQSAAKNAIRAMHDGDDYLYVRGGNGYKTMLVHPDPRKEDKDSDGGKAVDGRVVTEALVQDFRNSNFIFVQLFTKRPNGDVEVMKINGVERIADWDWAVGSGAFVDDINQTFWHYVLEFSAIAGLLLLGVVALAVSLSRGIYKSIGGEPAYAAAVARAIASGDLSQNVSHQGKDSSLLGAMAAMQNNLKSMISQIKQGADTLSRSGDALANQMSQINMAAQRSSEATSATAAAIEEMAVSVAQISDNAKESERNSERASELAGSGGQLVEQAASELQQVASQVDNASQRIAGLVERSREIDGIANVIKEIADQTNLLALNAAIEAARAGEQGRGFAVVADEVRKLAERSSKATDQIAGVIRAIQADTEAVVGSMHAVTPQVARGVEVAGEAGRALQEINEGAGKTLVNIQEVALSTEEQRLASNNVAVNVEQISLMVEEMAGAVDIANGNVRDLEQLANELRESVTRFRI